MADSLGYYSDKVGHLDTYTEPADRKGERCLNCDKEHGSHFGWACEGKNADRDFDELSYSIRYITASMRKSRGLPPKGNFAYKYDEGGSLKPEYSGDVSEWRTWAKVKPGECACAIPRHQCKYHGEAKVA